VEIRLEPQAIVDDLRAFGVPTRFVRDHSA